MEKKQIACHSVCHQISFHPSSDLHRDKHESQAELEICKLCLASFQRTLPHPQKRHYKQLTSHVTDGAVQSESPKICHPAK